MACHAPFKSEFMLLDVKRGRQVLARRIRAGEKVDIWIKATIEGASGIGRDDGDSIEFTATVHSIKVRDGASAPLTPTTPGSLE